MKDAADQSFNCITIDGDTSTNDSFMLIATGAGGHATIDATRFGRIRGAARRRDRDCREQLAQMIVRDGEGATKFITVAVEDGASVEECRKVAYSIAHSPLVKTAFFAIRPEPRPHPAPRSAMPASTTSTSAKLDLYLDDVWVAKNGGRNPDYQEEDGQRVMKQSEITVRVELARGSARATVWTCDLSHDYVSINADYRS